MTTNRKQKMTSAVLGCVMGLALAAIPALCAEPSAGQTGGIGKTGGKAGGDASNKGDESVTGKTGGKGKTPPALAAPAPPEVSVGKASQKVRIERPNEGFLAVATTAFAKVSLYDAHGHEVLTRKTNKDGAPGNLPPMPPGKYRLKIAHEDCELYTLEIKIEKGNIVYVTKSLVSKYGTIELTMDSQASKEVVLVLDGNTLLADKAEFQVKDKDTLIIRKVPVGKHKLSVSKDKYKPRDWEELDLPPGEIRNISATLERATVRLTVSSLFSDARVYVSKFGESGRELRGQIKGQTPVQIDLPPGDYKLNVELDGYEPFEKQVKLKLDTPSVAESVRLDPIADPESSDDFRGDYWYPSIPGTWQVENGRGRLIRGDGVGIFRRGQKETHLFNYYRDFTLVFKVAFNNRKGAVWIARARDEKNYYRFELTTSRSSRGEKLFIGSICTNGTCVVRWTEEVAAKIEEPNEVLKIKLVASGNVLSHFIEVPSDPSDKMRPLGPEITDETFKVGGVGLCGAGGVEMSIKQFLVIPRAVLEQ